MKLSYPVTKEIKAIGKILVALGAEPRQRILGLFGKGERLNIGQITAEMTISRSAIVHHLKVLKNAGVLESEKVGKEVLFWVNKPFTIAMLREAIDLFRRIH
jgi:DNA-binding transcriptional ArsR family regulator